MIREVSQWSWHEIRRLHPLEDYILKDHQTNQDAIDCPMSQSVSVREKTTLQHYENKVLEGMSEKFQFWSDRAYWQSLPIPALDTKWHYFSSSRQISVWRLCLEVIAYEFVVTCKSLLSPQNQNKHKRRWIVRATDLPVEVEYMKLALIAIWSIGLQQYTLPKKLYIEKEKRRQHWQQSRS